MFKYAATTLAILLSGATALTFSTVANAEMTEVREKQPVVVTIDRAKVFRISSPASTVIIGNPSIADATVEDDVTLVLTGRSFGVTNLIVLDRDGQPIVDETIVVRGHEENTVRIYRRDERVTLACAPVCEPTLTIGDNAQVFEFAQEQIEARNSLSEGAK
ncbi:MAG: pilus assembly protein N-terminal domain-containing protein [Salaquimonas sp.]